MQVFITRDNREAKRVEVLNRERKTALDIFRAEIAVADRPTVKTIGNRDFG